RSGTRTYTIAGILGPTFAFHECSFFAPLGNDASYHTITLLKPGVDPRKVLMALPKTVEYEGARLQPLASPFTIASVVMLAALVMLVSAYAFLRGRHVKLYVCARIVLGLLSVTAINLATARSINRIFPILSVLQFWIFCG